MNIFESKLILPFLLQTDLEIFLEMLKSMTRLFYAVTSFHVLSALVNNMKVRFLPQCQNLLTDSSWAACRKYHRWACACHMRHVYGIKTRLVWRSDSDQCFESHSWLNINRFNFLNKISKIISKRNFISGFFIFIVWLHWIQIYYSCTYSRYSTVPICPVTLGIPNFIFLWVTILRLCFEILVKITVLLFSNFINDVISSRSNQKSSKG